MALVKITCTFGKAPAKRDHRNIDLLDVLRKTFPVPAEYDVDDKHKNIPIPPPTYRNPPDNNCVIAGRAHQTLRFELVEQKRLIDITDADVELEYKKQTGGDKNKEIETLDSLNLWQKRGWDVAGQHFRIEGFAEIKNRTDIEVMKRAIYAFTGIGVGFFLPDSAESQFNNGEPWDLTRDKADGQRGHYVYVSGYTKYGPVCITWGRKQQMSWEFLAKYSDEAYAIFDQTDTPEKKQNFDEEKFKKLLAALRPGLKTDSSNITA
jgi:hypothetical protein